MGEVKKHRREVENVGRKEKKLGDKERIKKYEKTSGGKKKISGGSGKRRVTRKRI